jgi:hypothetical protein
MKDVKSFDGDLKMFREAPQGVNLERLRFLRWLVEQGRLEHGPAGPPSGEFATQPMPEAA